MMTTLTWSLVLTPPKDGSCGFLARPTGVGRRPTSRTSFGAHSAPRMPGDIIAAEGSSSETPLCSKSG